MCLQASVKPLHIYGDFLTCQNGGRPPNWILEIQNFVSRLSHDLSYVYHHCVIIPNFMAMCWTLAELWRFNVFSKWWLSAILDFKNWNFWQSVRLRGSICIIMQNFVAIVQRYGIFEFSRWWPSAILDLLKACLDNPQRVNGGLYHCTKFRWNRCSSSDNMQVLIFNKFGLKMPIHALKMKVLGIIPCKWGAASSQSPKGILVYKYVTQHIDH